MAPTHPKRGPHARRSVPLGHPLQRAWGGVAIFSIMAVVYGWIQSGPTFLDPDSFYHARMAALVAERGIVKPFPWLPFTTLADAFADHHFLYHLLLVPFVWTLGALTGTKVASVLFAAAAITMFYVLLRSFSVPWAFLFALGLGCSGGFLVRLNLAKASALSLCAVMAAVIFIEKRRPRALFVLSWLFVWLYGGWPVMLVVAAVFLGGRALLRGMRGMSGPVRPEILCALAVLAGLGTGLVVHPYFPQSLKFYWEQIVQIAILGYGGRIEVGSEWYPFPPTRLVAELGLVFFLPILGLLVLLPVAFGKNEEGPRENGQKGRRVDGPRSERHSEEAGRRSGTMPGLRRIFGGQQLEALLPASLMAAFFLVMTLRSRRYVEYFAPFAMIFDALLLRALLARVRVGEALARARAAMGGFAFLPALVLGYLALLLLFFPVRDVISARAYYRDGIPWTRFSGACAWLAGHTPEGSIVFHSDFNEFPLLFFHDTHNRYINGLDSTFLYRKNPEKYRIWADISSGRWKAAVPADTGPGQSRTRGGVSEVILREFDARTVFIAKDHDAMRALIEGDRALQLAYEDDEAWIYQIPGSQIGGSKVDVRSMRHDTAMVSARVIIRPQRSPDVR